MVEVGHLRVSLQLIPAWHIIQVMNAVDVAEQIKPLHTRLHDLGVDRLLLIGSTLKGTADAKSDVDFIVEFADKPTFLAFMELKELLEATLKRSVDITTKNALRPEIAADVLAQALQVA